MPRFHVLGLPDVADVQVFIGGLPVFVKGEVTDVTEDVAVLLRRSPLFRELPDSDAPSQSPVDTQSEDALTEEQIQAVHRGEAPEGVQADVIPVGETPVVPVLPGSPPVSPVAMENGIAAVSVSPDESGATVAPQE
jgi:hypothetical protein